MYLIKEDTIVVTFIISVFPKDNITINIFSLGKINVDVFSTLEIELKLVFNSLSICLKIKNLIHNFTYNS